MRGDLCDFLSCGLLAVETLYEGLESCEEVA